MLNVDVILIITIYFSQIDLPRPKHQTQPLYTAPRMTDHLDRVSPLNNRRTGETNSYHDKSNLPSVRPMNKNRRQSTHTYASSLMASSKDLSPTNSLNSSSISGGSYYEGKNNKDGSISSGGGSANQKMYSKKLVKRKKTTTSNFDSNSSNILINNNKSRTSANNNNSLGNSMKIGGTSSR